MSERTQIAARFRGYLPVVVDLETGGFNPNGDAILELAAVLLTYDGNRLLQNHLLHYHVAPLPGTNMDPASLRFTGIDPYHPLRKARAEPEVFQDFFRGVRKAVKEGGCTRAIVVAHNAAFDHQFIMSGANRNNINATRSTRFRSSIPRLSRQLHTVRRCSARRAHARGSHTTATKHTRRATTPRSPRNSFARSSTDGRTWAAGRRPSDRAISLLRSRRLLRAPLLR